MAEVKPLTQRPWHFALVAFLVSHVLATVIVDSQSVVPRRLYPRPVVELLDWYIDSFGDHLVRDNPSWFVSLVYCELLVQLPFFLVGIYAFTAGKNWIRIPAVCYGIHAATTLVPIMTAHVSGPQASPFPVKVCLMYFPFFLVPMLLAVYMAVTPLPFPVHNKAE